MDQFKYIGDPNDDGSGPDKLAIFGYEFKKNELVGIDDKAVAKKLDSHSHFVREGEEVVITPRESDGLAQLKVDDLKAVAAEEGVEINDGDTKARIIEAIRAHRKG